MRTTRGARYICAEPPLTRVASGPMTAPRASDDSSSTAPEGDSRTVPAYPELVRLLRDHLTEFGNSSDSRLFSGVRGGELSTITYRRAWIKAREAALTAAEQASPLVRRPYDLRHACLSTWLNGGVYPTQVAQWAGHSVDVLLRTYGTDLAQRPASGRSWPCRAATGHAEQDHDKRAYPQVRHARAGSSDGGAAGARTQDRRIMSPLL